MPLALGVAPPAAPSLSAILKARDLDGAMTGAIVMTADGRPLFAQNPDVRMNPASNEKLFSVAFALDTLGPDYRSSTRFWRDADSIGIESDGTLDLSYARLQQFAKGFGQRSRVILWQAYRPLRAESWQLEDTPNRYCPVVAAFCCEKGGMELWADASSSPELRPAAFGARIAGPAEVPDWIETRPIAKGWRYDPINGVLYPPTGTVLAPGRIDTLSQAKPDFSAASLFSTKDGEIIRSTIDPRVVRRRAPDAVLLADPLREVVGRCLKPSDNFLAENLLMMAATMKTGRPADYASATAALRAWSQSRVGLPDRSFDPADGSGMSRKDFVTARSVARLLNWSRRQNWGGIYFGAMATPDAGTIKGRMPGVRFRGKTGTLDGVSALSGLVKCKSGRELAVSLLMNHYSCPTARVHQIQDQFVKRVAASY